MDRNVISATYKLVFKVTMSKNNLKEQQLTNECNRRACELVKEKYLDLKVAKVVDEYKD